MPPATVDDLIGRALDAYAELASLGEEVEDEWTYVTDLEAAWRARLDEVAGARAAEPAPAAIEAAIDRAIEEVALIRDPHRAIDWLSTFPQVVLTALGERP
jgi:thioesterase domain-containing protein